MAAVAQDGVALRYAAAELQKDREVVMAAVAQDGGALYFAAAELKDQYGHTPSAFLPAAQAAVAAEAAATAATAADPQLDPRPAKKQRLDPKLEERLARWMDDKTNVPVPALNTLATSAFLPAYNDCQPPRDGAGAWATPIATVAQVHPPLPWHWCYCERIRVLVASISVSE